MKGGQKSRRRKKLSLAWEPRISSRDVLTDNPKEALHLRSGPRHHPKKKNQLDWKQGKKVIGAERFEASLESDKAHGITIESFESLVPGSK